MGKIWFKKQIKIAMVPNLVEMQRKPLDVIYQTWEFDSKPLLSSMNQHEAMLFMFLTQTLLLSWYACSERGDPGTADIYFWGVYEPSAHSCQTLPLHHFKLKTTSFHWPKAANTHKHKRTTATNSNGRTWQTTQWPLSRAQTTVSCSSNRPDTFWRATVVQNENHSFLD